jgi:hypothetical protein
MAMQINGVLTALILEFTAKNRTTSDLKFNYDHLGPVPPAVAVAAVAVAAVGDAESSNRESSNQEIRIEEEVQIEEDYEEKKDYWRGIPPAALARKDWKWEQSELWQYTEAGNPVEFGLGNRMGKAR